MSGEVYVFAVIAVMALSVVALLVVALTKGRRPPLRTGPWVVALVVTVLPAILITIVAIAAGLQGSGWLVAGAIGLWTLVALTVVNARWAAWAYGVSGIAFPIILAVGELLVPAGETLMIEPASAFLYTGRVLVAAGLLIWATQRAHHANLAPRVTVTPT